MPSYSDIVRKMKNEIDCQIHFSECFDETIWLSLEEVEDWLDEIEMTIKRKDLSSAKKLQMIVDSITKE